MRVMRLALLMISFSAVVSNFSGCVTQPVEQPEGRYTYTVINENRLEPFAQSPCGKNPEYGITRINARHDSGGAIFVCSTQPLRRLEPLKFAVDPGPAFAVATQNPDGTHELLVTRDAGNDDPILIDYSQNLGLRIAYPLAAQDKEDQQPKYNPLFSRAIECKEGQCELHSKDTCHVSPKDTSKIVSFISKQDENSPWKTINQSRVTQARQAGCLSR